MKLTGRKAIAIILTAGMVGLCGCSYQNAAGTNSGSKVEAVESSQKTTTIESSTMESEIEESSSEIISSESTKESSVDATESSEESSTDSTENSEESSTPESDKIEEESSDWGASENTQRTTYDTSEDGAHAIEVDGETVVYEGIEVNKTGSSDGEDADFYGENAAVFATNGADVTITDAVINTDGGHANGVFSYGEGTVVTISDSTILTSANNSGGVMITGGGTLYGDNLYIVTQGGSSAAIRSDRGGGTVVIDGGYYETNGKGSPAIYSTADITVTGAQLIGNVSEGVVVEGQNSVTLVNCDVTANHTEKNSNKSDAYQAVKIYQSMSGDAEEGMAYFTMTGGSMTSLNGGMFWISNTQATVSIENVSFTYATEDFLTVEAAGWGTDGANGGHVFFYAKNQVMDGVITVDEISTLYLDLQEGTVFTGAIASDGETDVVVEEGATWVLTGDSYVSSLDNMGTIDLSGYSLYVNGVLYE
ncbi:MAG: hypothetical protein J6P72_09720 [Firmicutes bacterium]|nr:hypothetical protein [Bacillota bacterium]